MTSADAYAPREVAERVVQLGVKKAREDTVTLLLLAVLAGAFIALGGLLYAVVITGSQLGFGPTRLLGGAAFSLGLVLVVVAGAELFTGNNLVIMAWASGLVRGSELLRSWLIVYLGNFVGATLTALAAWAGGVQAMSNGAVGETLLGIARHKSELGLGSMLILGVLCNALVCLAVWLTQAGHSVVDKVVGIVFPISAFVALGFEHSIANMFFLPYGLLLGAPDPFVTGAARNLLAVTLGNVIGGSGLVAGIYWLAYLRSKPSGGEGR